MTETAGPNMAGAQKKTRHYSKRIIVLFILLIGGIIALLAFGTSFKIGSGEEDKPERSYYPPSPSGFAELAASMRRERRPVQPVPDRPPQRIVIEGRMEQPAPQAPQKPRSALPRHYSDKDDAQAANQLRTLKLQALAAKPIVEDFPQERRGGSERQERVNTQPQVMGSAAAGQSPAGQSIDPGDQAGKQAFLRGADGGASMTPQEYSANLPSPQQFPYELKAGTVIPGILISGVNSDLPGNVLGQVSENVWDSATGKFVLIPKGTRILGVYDSQVSFGQKRVLLVWNRLIFPNGTTLDIAGSPGIDQAGYSGLSGKVNEHWGKMFGTALLASMFVAGSEIVYDKDEQGDGSDNKSPRDLAAESLAGSILDMGTKLMNRAMDIQPTITIRPGKRMGIFVQRDVVFPFPYF